jgi:predicted RNA-binding protein with PUA-like domain
MRDGMQVGDECFFYHSSCEVPGIAGLCRISKVNVIDKLQFDKKSEYFDPKSKTEKPTWVCVEVEFVKKFDRVISLTEIKELAKSEKDLFNMRLLQLGSRLSVQPVKPDEYKCISKHFGLL